MTRQEFMNRLSDLLSDISPEERDDALNYYEDYFEDAGPDKEADILSQLGSPEKVAASIKKNLTKSFDSGERNSAYDAYHHNDYNYNEANGNPRKSIFEVWKEKLNNWSFYREHQTLTVVFAVIIGLCLFPVLLKIAGGILGIIIGFLSLLLGIVAISFAFTVVGLVGGVGLIIAGFATLTASVAAALLLIGLGIIFLGFGTLFIWITVLLCGTFIPWIFRSIKNLFTTTTTMGGAGA